MVAKFNALLETPLADLLAEFVPPADQSPEVIDWAPQVINEDSIAITASGGGGRVDKDDEVMQIDNPAGVLSSN